MNVLILCAATGGGHIQASRALKAGLESKYQGGRIEIVDGLNYISPVLDKTISKGYLVLAKYLKRTYKILYRLTDKHGAMAWLVEKLTAQFSNNLMPLINEFKPDIIITTHPFITGMISTLKKRNKINSEVVCTMTDYEVHGSWVHKDVDIYSVAWDGMIQPLIDRGISPEKVHSFGIPVNKKFFINCNEDKKKLKEELGLDNDKITLLVMAGSFGVNNIKEIYEEIEQIPMEFQVVILTGNNDRLYGSLEKIVSRSSKKTRLIEFTNDVYRYMSMADILITKPGGLTVSEALASNLPFILFDAIPGQEEANAKFLIDNGMAISIGKGKGCRDKIEALLRDENRLQEMKKNCEKFDKSKSIDRLVDMIDIDIQREAVADISE